MDRRQILKGSVAVVAASVVPVSIVQADFKRNNNVLPTLKLDDNLVILNWTELMKSSLVRIDREDRDVEIPVNLPSGLILCDEDDKIFSGQGIIKGSTSDSIDNIVSVQMFSWEASDFIKPISTEMIRVPNEETYIRMADKKDKSKRICILYWEGLHLVSHCVWYWTTPHDYEIAMKLLKKRKVPKVDSVWRVNRDEFLFPSEEEVVKFIDEIEEKARDIYQKVRETRNDDSRLKKLREIVERTENEADEYENQLEQRIKDNFIRAI